MGISDVLRLRELGLTCREIGDLFEGVELERPDQAVAVGGSATSLRTLVGAVLGVGLARGLAATNFATVSQIALSWIVTLPAGAGLCVLFYWLLRAVF